MPARAAKNCYGALDLGPRIELYRVMGKLLERLLVVRPSVGCTTGRGSASTPVEAEFDDLVRTIANGAGTEYVAFPRPAGPHHYDGILVVRFDT